MEATALNLAKEVAALQRMTVKQLREKYAAVFGETTSTGNRTWLMRRIRPVSLAADRLPTRTGSSDLRCFRPQTSPIRSAWTHRRNSALGYQIPEQTSE